MLSCLHLSCRSSNCAAAGHNCTREYFPSVRLPRGPLLQQCCCMVHFLFDGDNVPAQVGRWWKGAAGQSHRSSRNAGSCTAGQQSGSLGRLPTALAVRFQGQHSYKESTSWSGIQSFYTKSSCHNVCMVAHVMMLFGKLQLQNEPGPAPKVHQGAQQSNNPASYVAIQRSSKLRI